MAWRTSSAAGCGSSGTHECPLFVQADQQAGFARGDGNLEDRGNYGWDRVEAEDRRQRPRQEVGNAEGAGLGEAQDRPASHSQDNRDGQERDRRQAGVGGDAFSRAAGLCVWDAVAQPVAQDDTPDNRQPYAQHGNTHRNSQG